MESLILGEVSTDGVYLYSPNKGERDKLLE